MLNLYLMSQTECSGYDTYDSCVVAAESEKEAHSYHPAGNMDPNYDNWRHDFNTWCQQGHASVQLIGVAAEGVKPGVIISSFNAG